MKRSGSAVLQDETVQDLVQSFEKENPALLRLVFARIAHRRLDSIAAQKGHGDHQPRGRQTGLPTIRNTVLHLQVFEQNNSQQGA